MSEHEEAIRKHVAFLRGAREVPRADRLETALDALLAEHRAEVERLTRERDEVREMHSQLSRVCVQHQRDRDAAREQGRAAGLEEAASRVQCAAKEALRRRDSAPIDTPQGQSAYRAAEAQWDVLASLAEDIRALAAQPEKGQEPDAADALATVRDAFARVLVAPDPKVNGATVSRFEAAVSTLERTLAELRARAERAEAERDDQLRLTQATLVQRERAEAEREETLRMWREYKSAKDADVASADKRALEMCAVQEAEMQARIRAEADNAALLEALRNLYAREDTNYDKPTVDVLRQPHPGAALLERHATELHAQREAKEAAQGRVQALSERLRTLEQRLDDAAVHLHGHQSFTGPCEHGRVPWDRCDDCGEGNAVQAAVRRIAQLERESVPVARVRDVLATTKQTARERSAGDADRECCAQGVFAVVDHLARELGIPLDGEG